MEEEIFHRRAHGQIERRAKFSARAARDMASLKLTSAMNPLPQRAAATLRAARSLEDAPALAGFDGFIDTICHAVGKRHDAQRYDRIPTLREFGERIAAAAGKSTNVEIVPTLVKLGGNGPIMANALCALGLDVTYCGMTGYPNTRTRFLKSSAKAPNCCRFRRPP